MESASFVIALAVLRLVIGLGPIVTPHMSAKLMGITSDQNNATARMMARLFGIRNAGLGLLALVATTSSHWLGPVCLFNALHDASDAVITAISKGESPGFRTARRNTLVLAIFAATAWLGAWLIA